jgi:hypothetical protein
MLTKFSDEVSKALLDYESIKIEIKELETQLGTLKEVILPEVPEGSKIVTESGGSFELKQRDNWKYSDDIQQLEEELKSKKAEAVAKGEVTNNPTFYIEYRSAK